ncbi:hypothetical protein [Paractinoplanes maris]|uniref:hypothetical protein n=1 Tax=Paractinoplanes maris TaxID=1734446 RepID=UPI00202001B5|nr:hypothetical protein [Actinoplanes maris]
MNSVGLDAWQVPILVTAAIVLVEAGFNVFLRYRGLGPPSQRVRTAGFGVLVLLTVTVFVAALGPTRADQLSSVAAAVAAVVALWLTYRSYNTAIRKPPESPAEEPAGKSAAGPDNPGES